MIKAGARQGGSIAGNADAFEHIQVPTTRGQSPV